MSIFTGAGVAIITPFNDDDTVRLQEEFLLLQVQVQTVQEKQLICQRRQKKLEQTDFFV